MLPLIIDTTNPQQNGLLNNFLSPGQGLEQDFVRGDRKLALMHRPVVPNPQTNTTLNWADDWLDSDTFEIAIGNPDTPPNGGMFELGVQRVGTKTITSVSVAFPSVINCVAHGMTTGDVAIWYGMTGSTPDLNGQFFTVTVTDADNFTIPVNVTVGGTGGTLISFNTNGLTALPYNIGAGPMATAISAASTTEGYGNVNAAVLEPGNYEVSWITAGAVPNLYVNGNGLSPASTGFVASIIVGSGSTEAVQLLELSQLPVAFCQPSTPLPIAAITATVAQHGASGPPAVNKVYSVTTTSGTYGGTFSISLTTIDSVTTSFIASGITSANDLQTQLNTATGITSGDISVTGGNGTLNIQFGGTQSGSDAPVIAVSNIDLLAPLGVTGSMDLNTNNLYLAFAETTAQSLSFTFAIRRTRATGEEAEYFQHSVTLKRNLINTSTIVPVTLPSYYTQAQVDALLALKANIASPTFTGVPSGPTASPGTNTTQLATTAFVAAAVALEDEWQVKTSDFTAAIRGRYQVDCSGGAVTMTLPVGMGAGDWIQAEDATESWGTHTFTIAVAASGFGTKINSGTSSFTDTVLGDKLSLVGISSGQGVKIS